MKINLLLVAGLTFSLGAFAQTIEPLVPTPVFRAHVTSRSIQAVNYRHRDGATKLDFAGTALMPAANGQAKIESKKGYIEIEVEFGNLAEPKTYGNEYLTYILWAISPEGRAINLGEVLLGGNHRSKLDVTTDLQAFALIVTAEPYFAVRQPSDVVVIENVVRADTKGTTEAVNAKYELLDRGGYIPTGYNFDPVVMNAKLPIEFFEARNALRIAQSEGAERYASDSYQHAVKLMNQADGYAVQKNVPKQPLSAVSREAVQTAEDARAIAVKKIDEERLASERQASANDTANARSAEALAESDAARARRAAAKAEADAAQAKSDQANSEAASAGAVAAAQADAEKSRLAALQSETEKTAMRTRLSEQLNSILQTRDSARGLIVSMSDVLFDTGKFSLKPGAREKLAKVAGILLAYPGLNIEVGGYTDNVGSDAMNQALSENRAGSVRNYLVEQGVASASVTAKGFGETLPVATNDDAAGRQQNRRVELLVSGEAIGHSVIAVGSLR